MTVDDGAGTLADAELIRVATEIHGADMVATRIAALEKAEKAARETEALLKEVEELEAAADTVDVRSENARLRYEWLEATRALTGARERGDLDTVMEHEWRRECVKNDFVKLNRGLAMAGAKRFLAHARGENLRDHEQAALLGLWEAFVGTDPAKAEQVTEVDGRLVAAGGWDPVKATFGTFSRSYISGRVRRSVAVNESGLSYALWTYRPQVLAARDELAAEFGGAPSPKQVASRCGLPLDTVSAILTPNQVSLQTPIGDDGLTLGDQLAASAAAEEEFTAEEVEFMATYLVAAAPQIGVVDLLALLLRTGLAGRPELSVVDTAARLGLGRGAVGAGVRRAWPKVATLVRDASLALALMGLAFRSPETLRLMLRSGVLADTPVRAPELVPA